MIKGKKEKRKRKRERGKRVREKVNNGNRYLDLKSVGKCLSVNKRWQKMGTDGQIWMHKYAQDFPQLFLAEKNFNRYTRQRRREKREEGEGKE